MRGVMTKKDVNPKRADALSILGCRVICVAQTDWTVGGHIEMALPDTLSFALWVRFS
jgi:hypothetical protein